MQCASSIATTEIFPSLKRFLQGVIVATSGDMKTKTRNLYTSTDMYMHQTVRYQNDNVLTEHMGTGYLEEVQLALP